MRRTSKPRVAAIPIGSIRPSGERATMVLRRQLAESEAALELEKGRHKETQAELDRVMARLLRLEGDRSRMRRERILLVDDHHELREMYAEYLEYAGYEVVQAVDGQHAFDVALRRKPALIVMDLAMPHVDGWAATRNLRAHDETGCIPVIALTGYLNSGYVEEARVAGCTKVLTKPCLPDELRCVIAEMLDAPISSRVR